MNAKKICPKVSKVTKRRFKVWKNSLHTFPLMSPDTDLRLLRETRDAIGDIVNGEIKKQVFLQKMARIYEQQIPDRFFRVSDDPREFLWVLQQLGVKQSWVWETLKHELAHASQFKMFAQLKRIEVPYHYGYYSCTTLGDGFPFLSLNTVKEAQRGNSLFDKWSEQRIREYFIFMNTTMPKKHSGADAVMTSRI